MELLWTGDVTAQVLQDAIRAHQAGNFTEATQLYRQVLQANPRDFQGLYLLGFMQYQQGLLEDARRLIGKALKVNPRAADAWYNYGCVFMALSHNAEALSSFDAALAIAPDYLDALVNRSAALMALGRNEEALGACERALEILPDAIESLNLRGEVLQRLSREESALAAYDTILKLYPNNAEAHRNRGNIFLKKKRLEEAIAEYEKAVAADPDSYIARGNLLHCKLHTCDWRGRDEQRRIFARDVRFGRRVLGQIENLAFTSSAEDQLLCFKNWSTSTYPATANPLWRGERYSHERIRVAYLSADFHSHATAYLMAGVFEAHDRTRFETTAISFGPIGDDPWRGRLQAAFGSFLDVGEKSDSAIAELLRQHEIDIAIDLKGYTFDARPGILAFRPAPVQVNYLGFPGTMGADTIDYIVADKIIIPEDQRQYYSEKVVYLPDSYQCNDARKIAARAPSRTEAGLPETGFVFCCFNANYKITPDMFELWMRLLHQIDGSVLWLLESNQTAPLNLRREAAARGIAPDRVIFAPTVPTDEHLARQSLADLFLDTLPYNAHTTASDALWVGLPILTCLGTTFAGRVPASLLSAIDMPELITASLAEYEALALRLAEDASALASVRKKIMRNRPGSRLFDTNRFCRNLEAAYTTMWERQQRGEPPAHFAVAPS